MDKILPGNEKAGPLYYVFWRQWDVLAKQTGKLVTGHGRKGTGTVTQTFFSQLHQEVPLHPTRFFLITTVFRCFFFPFFH
jgi:hypothetical protein